MASSVSSPNIMISLTWQFAWGHLCSLTPQTLFSFINWLRGFYLKSAFSQKLLCFSNNTYEFSSSAAEVLDLIDILPQLSVAPVIYLSVPELTFSSLTTNTPGDASSPLQPTSELPLRFKVKDGSK